MLVLVHIWWDNAPYFFGWVEHRLCCSNGQLRRVMTGYWTCSGHFFSTVGMFWIVWDCFDSICMFSTVALNDRFVDLSLFLNNAILVIYIFVRFLIYEGTKHCKTKLIYQPNAHLVPRHKLILSQVTQWPLLCVNVSVDFNRKDFVNSQYYLRSEEWREPLYLSS